MSIDGLDNPQAARQRLHQETRVTGKPRATAPAVVLRVDSKHVEVGTRTPTSRHQSQTLVSYRWNPDGSLTRQYRKTYSTGLREESSYTVGLRGSRKTTVYTRNGKQTTVTIDTAPDGSYTTTIRHGRCRLVAEHFDSTGKRIAAPRSSARARQVSG